VMVAILWASSSVSSITMTLFTGRTMRSALTCTDLRACLSALGCFSVCWFSSKSWLSLVRFPMHPQQAKNRQPFQHQGWCLPWAAPQGLLHSWCPYIRLTVQQHPEVHCWG
jgi:hypothetical protein